MRPSEQTPRVIIRHCDTYDTDRIRTILREGLEELGLRPSGRTLVKPNLVCAGPMFEHAHTRPEFVEAMALALGDRDEGQMSELAVGERCGITVPTRDAFKHSGVERALKRHGIKRYYFEEEPQVEIPLTHEGRLRDYLFTPEPVAKADFFVNCPKFKAHPWTTVTFANKAYIGIQDDRHRLIDHDVKLNHKIADLQYIIQPEFIAIDAIIAGEGRMLTPIPRQLGLIIMGNNQVAFDAVCCDIIGVDAREVEHIQLAHERGFGTLSLSEIQLSGDVTLEQAKERAKGFKVGLIRVEKYFEGTNISAYAGPPPASEGSDYCWGGCPGAIEEAIEILRLYDESLDEKLPRIHVIFGDYQGPIDAKPGEKVVFIGDCATWKGTLHGEAVEIESEYRLRSTIDPHTVVGEDAMDKMRKTRDSLREARQSPYLRLRGCPVSVTEQVFALVQLSGIKNPMMDPARAGSYLSWKTSVGLKRILGHKYQIHGEAERGRARPEGMQPRHLPVVPAE